MIGVGVWVGLTVGLLHWWMFQVNVNALSSPEGSNSRLRTAALGFGYARLIVTGILLVLMRRQGVPTSDLAIGLLGSVPVYRLYRYWQSKEV